MNLEERTIDDNLRDGLLKVTDIPNYDYKFCKTKTYYDWLNRELIGEDHFKFMKSQYDDARHHLNTCGRPNNDGDRHMINHYKEITKKYGRKLTGENLYLNTVKREFEKTTNYKMLVLENYIKTLTN